jgi:hypothetical protein
MKGGTPDFNWLDYGQTDKFQTSLLELCDFSVSSSVDDDVGHDVMGLEVVQRDDSAPPAGSRIHGGERSD